MKNKKIGKPIKIKVGNETYTAQEVEMTNQCSVDKNHDGYTMDMKWSDMNDQDIFNHFELISSFERLFDKEEIKQFHAYVSKRFGIKENVLFYLQEYIKGMIYFVILNDFNN